MLELTQPSAVVVVPYVLAGCILAQLGLGHVQYVMVVFFRLLDRPHAQVVGLGLTAY